MDLKMSSFTSQNFRTAPSDASAGFGLPHVPLVSAPANPNPLPQGSKLAAYMGRTHQNSLNNQDQGGSDQSPSLKKLSISGIQEFVPSGARNNGENGSEINTYSDGGTMYFYSGEPDIIDPASGAATGPNPTVMSANFSLYTGTPNYVAEMRVSGPDGLEGDIRRDILRMQAVTLCQADPECDLPQEVDGYSEFCPLDAQGGSGGPLHKSHTFGYVTSVYKATSVKDGSAVCIRRVQNFRLVNSKCMVLVEQWRKLRHSNLVRLRQVFTSKKFGDQSMLFVYDFHAGAETLMAKHFTPGISSSALEFGMEFASARPGSGGSGSSMKKGGLLPESLIWNYVIQLTSALRHIHTAGLACRTLDPTKILVTSKSRLILNCCGMFDVLTFDPTASNPMAAMAHYQQEDLIALGEIVLALACNSFLAIQRGNLQGSMELVTSNYSSDMRTLIMYLLTSPGGVKSVNDLMPMIGARFYTSLDEANNQVDVLTDELSKDVESGRLFRLLTKLSTVVDRAELNGDTSWAEYGDRYMLKLFRDYVFHQVMDDGRPWLDMAHVISCLNKMDAGVTERVCLMSRDEQNVLVVSYAELKQCLVQSYAECVSSSRHAPSSTTSGGYAPSAGPEQQIY